MSKLYFTFAPMNAGKSALLIMKAHSFLEQHAQVLCIKPSVDNRDETDYITSRIGIKQRCLTIDSNDNIYDIFELHCINVSASGIDTPQWILCDEAQFLTAAQVDQLAAIVDKMGVNVMCYGLRSDFTGHLFEGSKRLFEIADNIEECKVACECGRKAIINARIDEFGNVINEGEQIDIGGNEKYKPMCRKCYNKHQI